MILTDEVSYYILISLAYNSFKSKTISESETIFQQFESTREL